MPPSGSTSTSPLTACHDCDLAQRLPPAPSHGSLRCARCGAVLRRYTGDPVEIPLALVLTALVLFVLSHSFPLLEFSIQGQTSASYIVAGAQQLWLQGKPALAVLVLLTTLIAPALHIGLMIYILGPLWLGRQPPALAAALRLAHWVLPWSMLEIFLLGVLVASVKLADQASVVPGSAAWSLGGLVLVLAAATTRIHSPQLWERVA